MPPRDKDRITNRTDTDQTVRSLSLVYIVFAKAYMNENLGNNCSFFILIYMNLIMRNLFMSCKKNKDAGQPV